MQYRDSENRFDASVMKDLLHCAIAFDGHHQQNGWRVLRGVGVVSAPDNNILPPQQSQSSFLPSSSSSISLSPLSPILQEEIALSQGRSVPTVLKISDIQSKPIWNIQWIADILEQSYDHVKQEYLNFVALSKECPDIHFMYTDSLTQSVNSGGSWRTNYFLEEGVWNRGLCDLCPYTSSILKRLPICECALGYAYFSIIKPGTHIKPHHGCSNCKLRIQLPIQVSDSCKIIIDGVEYTYKSGHPLIFDDSFRHEVNYQPRPTGDDYNEEFDRVVLIIDIWNPQLSQSAIDNISSAFGQHYYRWKYRRENQHQTTLQENNEINYSDERGSLSHTGGSLCTERLYPHHISSRGAQIQATGDFTEYDYLLKFLCIGNNGVGKSCTILRFADDTYNDSYMSTIGVDFKLRTIELDEKTIKCQIWDVAGPERFKRITSSYYKGAHGIFLMYDIRDRKSFDDIRFWYSETKKYAKSTTVLSLVGCKSDEHSFSPSKEVVREVTYEEGVALAAELNIPLFEECSSRTGLNVDCIFLALTAQIIAKFSDPVYLDEPYKAHSTVSQDSNTNQRKCTIS